MSRHYKEREEVYAVLRYDGFLSDVSAPEACVTVKEVVWSRELAEAEVARLNALRAGKDVRYWWQMTRLFPEGRSASD
jgi:hypothetical protein